MKPSAEASQFSPSAFDSCQLFISARSPFARRVRIALIEHEIKFIEKTLNVFEPNPEFLRVNPLARVPAVILGDGTSLVDSHSILEFFYEERRQKEAEEGMSPLDLADRKKQLQWSGLAVGLCEKIVEYFLETLRPSEGQDPEVFQEVSRSIDLTLGFFEEQLKKVSNPQSGDEREIRPWVGGASKPSQADIDLACALSYLSLRHPVQWRSIYPNLDSYLRENWEARPSYLVTLPPPAA
jgi:glutathione S-transferase